MGNIKFAFDLDTTNNDIENINKFVYDLTVTIDDSGEINFV